MQAWIAKNPLLAVAGAAVLGAFVGVVVNKKTGAITKIGSKIPVVSKAFA